MFRLWNKIRNKLAVLLCAIFVSCGFIDLRPIELKIEPDKSDSLLPDAYSPVILSFDTEMQKDAVEGLVQINSDTGSVKGDKYWKDNSLYFVPVQGWTAGIRYTLSLYGTINSEDGREIRIDRFISFYAINKNSPPVLENYSPVGGSSIGTKSAVFEFVFSCSMDKYTVESALTIEGIGNKTFEWFDDDKILRVTSEKTLSTWTMYKWNLKESAKSIDGVPLPKAYSDYFITDLDQSLPQVTNVYPVLFADGCWYPAGINLDNGLRSGHGIAVSFNKQMGENVVRSLRFEPSLTGRTELLSENSIVYIFTKDPEPETIFTLIVSGDTRDSEGLKIGSEYRKNFSVDIPYLNVLSVTTNNNQQIEDFTETNNILPVYVDQGTGLLTLSIYFSLMFGLEEKLNAPQKITLSPFFPRTLPPSALSYVHWISDDRLLLKWEGLKAGDEVPHYYKLTIPGGKGGISSDTGVFMKEDFVLYLEAIQ